MFVGVKILALQIIILASQNMLENIWLWSMGFFLSTTDNLVQERFKM